MITSLTLLVALALAPADPAAVDPNVEYAEIAALVEDARLHDATARLTRTTLPDGPKRRLLGLVALRRGRNDVAVRHFELALAANKDDAALRLYLASAQLGRGDAKAALVALEGTEILGETTIAQPLLLARAMLGTGDTDGAYATLETATHRFPTDVAPRVELMVLCAQHDLRASAREWATSILDLHGDAIDRDTLATIAAAIGRDRAALPLLEDLALRFDDDPELRARLAHAWASHGHWYTAATLFERASGTAGTYAFEAADQFRLAGFTARALAHNARVADASRRIDQRIDILFGAGAMARVVALEPAATRDGAPRPATRMRIAHAHWLLGQHSRAAALARGLLGTDEADRARTLLQAMGREETGE